MPDEFRNARFGFEAFECGPGMRLQANERVFLLRHEALEQRLDRIEAAVERLERRMWLAVYGVAAALLAEAILPLLKAMP